MVKCVLFFVVAAKIGFGGGSLARPNIRERKCRLHSCVEICCVALKMGDSFVGLKDELNA